jgi:hypothetical protein
MAKKRISVESAIMSAVHPNPVVFAARVEAIIAQVRREQPAHVAANVERVVRSWVGSVQDRMRKEKMQ